jgi:putative addiction module CopG family antidote
MNVALTPHWEGFIRQLIDSGRYNNASEVDRAAVRNLQEVEGESFPPGSLKLLYTKSFNEEETRLARRIRVRKSESPDSPESGAQLHPCAAGGLLKKSMPVWAGSSCDGSINNIR